MAKLRIYTNESVPTAIADGLRLRRVDAWSARDADHLGWSDEEQLEYACREQVALFTHDQDFLRITHQWAEEGKEHWGVIFIPPQRLGIGECIRRLFDVATILEAEDVKNRIEFL